VALGKNIVFTSILTVSNYIVPLIVFPYVSRVLGVVNLGKFGFVESVVSFALLFSMFGIYNLGVREIAKSRGNQDSLNATFSSLFFLNAINTIVVFFIFIFLIFTYQKFFEYKNLLFFGSFNILFNLFLIQWFFIGMEKISFVVYRTIALRILYVALVFIFVKNTDDYDVYYLLSVLFVFFNAIVNWFYSRNFVRLSIRLINFKTYLSAYFQLGLYAILTSLYTTFTVTYLGIVKSEADVGLYTTAVKIQTLFLALFTAVSTAVVPYVSKLVHEKNMEGIKDVVGKVQQLLMSIGLPIVICLVVLASEIINIISGSEYINASILLQIIAPTIVLIGFAQILVLQLLIPFGNDKIVLRNALVGATIGIVLNVILVNKFGAIGSAIVWLFSEIVVLVLAQIAVNRMYHINILDSKVIKQLFSAIPYVIICIIFKRLGFSPIITLALVGLSLFSYFIVLNIFVTKNPLLNNILQRIKN